MTQQLSSKSNWPISPFRDAVNWLTKSRLRAFVIIFILGMSLRLFMLTKVSERHILPHDRWENSSIALSLVEHGQFADPYMIPTGPTSHLPPLIPGILAAIWSLFGLGPVGGYVAWIFSFAAFSVLYALLPWLGEKFGIGRQAGFLGGLAGAMIILTPGNSEELAGIALGLLAIAFLRRWTLGLGSPWGSLLMGIACGIAFHLQPVIFPVALGWMIFELRWSKDRRKWYLAGIMILGMIIACSPWAWRNYKTFNEFYFIRGNLGLELRMAYHEDAAGASDVMDARMEFRHPRTHLTEAQAVKTLGEAEYMRRAKVEAIDWVIRHPTQFLKLTASRFTQFWFGPFHHPPTALALTILTLLALLGAWRSLPAMTHPQRGALMIPLIFYPIIYYILMYMPRYRIPLDWILLLLAGAAIWNRIPEKQPKRLDQDAASSST